MCCCYINIQYIDVGSFTKSLFYFIVYNIRKYMLSNTLKPVLRGHIWNKKTWPCKTGDL